MDKIKLTCKEKEVCKITPKAATRTNFFLFFIFFLPCFSLKAQQCGNCKVTPSVASYDLNVQVAQPQGSDNDLQSWKQLFWLARYANSYLFQQNKNCVRFIQPAFDEGNKKTTTKDGVELEPLEEPSEIMKVGEIVANVPGAGGVAYGGYITTGIVTKSGNGYVLHVEIQTACSRKKVTSADVSFQASSDSKYMEGIAHQAAQKLSPLIDKIKEFELKERKDRKDFAFGGNERRLIKIIPAKKSLLPGQSTDFTVQLTDCDGVGLGGREIVFTASKNELKIPGTIGGTVTPAKIVTDASGKATATFKMSAGNGQPAIINAHTISSTTKNCTDAFMGSAKVDALQAYKVELDYTLIGIEGGGVEIISPIAAIKGNGGKTYKVEYTITAFYYPPAGQNLNQRMIFITEETSAKDKVEIEPLTGQDDDEIEIEPLIQAEKIEIVPLIYHAKGYGIDDVKKLKGSIVHFYFSGSSESRSWDRPVSAVAQAVKYENIESGMPSSPVISMTFKNNDLIDFNGSVDFAEDRNGKTPQGGSMEIMKDDPAYYPVKPKKITDPNSPWKWEYTLHYKKHNAQSLDLGLLGKGEGKTEAVGTVRIYSAF